MVADHSVALRINYADIARSRVHHINLILLAVRRNPSRFASNLDGLRRLERAQVDNANRVALSIGDVGVLVVSRTVISELPLVEIPPPMATAMGERTTMKSSFLK